MSGFTQRDVLKTSAVLAGLPLAPHLRSEAEPNRITNIFFDTLTGSMVNPMDEFGKSR